MPILWPDHVQSKFGGRKDPNVRRALLDAPNATRHTARDMLPSLLLIVVGIALIALGAGTVALLWAGLRARNDRPLPSSRPVSDVALREAPEQEERRPTPPPPIADAPASARVEVAPAPPVAEREPEPPLALPEEPVVDEPPPTLAPRPTLRPAPPWNPIVLAHGVLGFDALRLGFLHPAYFRGVAETLRKAGNEVHVIRVSPVAGIAVRAAQLARQIREIPAERVNIVAHSMGGLDARYAISALGLGDRVASLTTIGTPHLGTPLADSGVWLTHERLGLRQLLELLGVDAFRELTTGFLEDFNRRVVDLPHVRYASYPARARGGARTVHSLLAPGYVLLEREVGDNDGVVPTASQRWGEIMGEIEADHWAQVGWSPGFDAARFYDQLVRALRRQRL